ncbi:uncharacterized protein LOC127749452 [Frankliniella occidentalis]|uniref:Uncharacterized protein LOC127749452 n=1 Tax=Frankliniella occidentalis TaxID=133901 RepID=A0A9C6WW11_FRAOC|nr:uncharacterized protein LOC127749452 [Frankliniella occidentalis]
MIYNGEDNFEKQYKIEIKNKPVSEVTAMETEIKRMETEESKASAAKKISTTPSPTMGNFLGRRSACVTQAEANSAIAAYIVQEMEPVSKVESAGLKNLVSVLTKGNSIPIYCPTRKGMNKMISDTYDEMMASVKKVLHEAPYVSTTADIWSKRNRSYMGLTAHTIQ